MLMNNTIFTRRATREAVQTTEQRVAGTTYLTRRGFGSYVQCFVSHELVGKLIPVLKPLF